MTASKIITIASAICGMLGTLLIYFFGVPKQIDTGGAIYIVTPNKDENEQKKIAKYKKFGNVGLFLIGISFLLQAISVFL